MVFKDHIDAGDQAQICCMQAKHHKHCTWPSQNQGFETMQSMCPTIRAISPAFKVPNYQSSNVRYLPWPKSSNRVLCSRSQPAPAATHPQEEMIMGVTFLVSIKLLWSIVKVIEYVVSKMWPWDWRWTSKASGLFCQTTAAQLSSQVFLCWRYHTE